MSQRSSVICKCCRGGCDCGCVEDCPVHLGIVTPPPASSVGYPPRDSSSRLAIPRDQIAAFLQGLKDQGRIFDFTIMNDGTIYISPESAAREIGEAFKTLAKEGGGK